MIDHPKVADSVAPVPPTVLLARRLLYVELHPEWKVVYRKTMLHPLGSLEPSVRLGLRLPVRKGLGIQNCSA
jgi:hypothetical protein